MKVERPTHFAAAFPKSRMKPQSSLVSKHESASWRALWLALSPKGPSLIARDTSGTARCRRIRDKCSCSEATVTPPATRSTSPVLGNLPNTTFKGEEGGCCWEHLVLFYCLPGTSGLKLDGNTMDVPEMGPGAVPARAHELSCLELLPKSNWISYAVNYYNTHTHTHTQTHTHTCRHTSLHTDRKSVV